MFSSVRTVHTTIYLSDSQYQNPLIMVVSADASDNRFGLDMTEKI